MVSPKVINNSIINYSKGDSFMLPVTDTTPFEDGMIATLIISASDTDEPIINATVSSSDGWFIFTLESEQFDNAAIGTYLYKITITDTSGFVVTQKSGNFNLNWGA